MASTQPPSATSKQDIWHHRGPVEFSPVFDRPVRPFAAFLTLSKRYVTLTRNALFLLMAIVIYHTLIPPLSQMASLSWEWVLPLFVRNIGLMLIVAGALHYYLFIRRGQGDRTKFDPRQQMDKSGKFTFGNQVWDNMFWSLASGVTIWSVYEVLYLWGAANLVIPVLNLAEHPIAVLIWLPLLPLIISTHFFWIHRLLHWPPLFHSVHKLHHRNIHIGPWSGMSMHPVEHILYLSSVLVHFVIPSHPVIFLMHLYTRCLTPAFSHAGFQQLIFNDKPVTEAADFHHQLHHRYFECNYGSTEVPWDRWIDAVHDGSDEGTARVQARRRKMLENSKTIAGKP